MGDYAGQELFLVEGDSLLLRCFSGANLDFDRESQRVNSLNALLSKYTDVKLPNRWLPTSARCIRCGILPTGFDTTKMQLPHCVLR